MGGRVDGGGTSGEGVDWLRGGVAGGEWRVKRDAGAGLCGELVRVTLTIGPALNTYHSDALTSELRTTVLGSLFFFRLTHTASGYCKGGSGWVWG